VVVPGLSNVVAVTTGHRTSCAWTREGKVLCWGELDRAADEAPPH